MDHGEAIQHPGHFLKFRADPAQCFKKDGMLGRKILPVNDALMMKNPVSQISNPIPSGIQLPHITLCLWSILKDLLRQQMSNPSLGMGFIKKARPKPKVKFCHDAAARHRTSILRKLLLRPVDQFFLPR